MNETLLSSVWRLFRNPQELFVLRQKTRGAGEKRNKKDPIILIVINPVFS